MAIDEQAYLAYVRAHRAALRRSAALICGDWHQADDLVQTALVSLYQNWPKVGTSPAVGAWLRQVLLRAYLDERRRPWRRDMPSDGLPDQAAAPDPRLDRDHLDTVAIRQALRQVPPRQRAALVLRFYDGLTVSETALALGCSAGTVKSQTAKGLDRLRRELGPSFLVHQETS